MKTFKQFVNEKVEEHKPLDGTCGTTIRGKTFEFNVGKIIDFAKKNYQSQIVNLNDIYELTFFKSVQNLDVIDKNAEVNINGEWKKESELSKEELKKFRDEQIEIINMSNLRYPIILTQNNRGRIVGILDGNHRVKKAKQLGKDSVRAYIIPEKDILNLSKEELDKLKKNKTYYDKD